MDFASEGRGIDTTTEEKSNQPFGDHFPAATETLEESSDEVGRGMGARVRQVNFQKKLVTLLG